MFAVSQKFFVISIVDINFTVNLNNAILKYGINKCKKLYTEALHEYFKV